MPKLISFEVPFGKKSIISFRKTNLWIVSLLDNGFTLTVIDCKRDETNLPAPYQHQDLRIDNIKATLLQAISYKLQ